MDGTESFPRRQALTRRFTLGEPRNIRVSADGTRVAFLRSTGPVDAVNSLWVLDVASGVERLVADPRRLGSEGDGQDLPPAERARRERVRETGSGIVSYDADEALDTAVFALGGSLWRVSLATGGPAPEALPAPTGAFDPRLSPDGARVAYVAGSSLRVTGDRAGDRLVAHEPATRSAGAQPSSWRPRRWAAPGGTGGPPTAEGCWPPAWTLRRCPAGGSPIPPRPTVSLSRSAIRPRARPTPRSPWPCSTSTATLNRSPSLGTRTAGSTWPRFVGPATACC